jgi:hypothetical protein
MTNLLALMGKLKLYRVTNWDSDSSHFGESEEVREPATTLDANVVSSLIEETEHDVVGDDPWFGSLGRQHALLLDLDVPAHLVPSSTPGNHHLYVDVRIPEEKYFELLNLLAECGVIQVGYAVSSIAKGGSCLRLPWVKKEAAA